MCMVVRMVAVPVPRFLKRYLARGLVQLFLAGLVELRSCLFTALVARRARCTTVSIASPRCVTAAGPHFAEPSTGELSTHASSGALGPGSSVGRSEAGLGRTQRQC